jgi:diguanylate cyclase (GGDEF)-like protein
MRTVILKYAYKVWQRDNPALKPWRFSPLAPFNDWVFPGRDAQGTVPECAIMSPNDLWLSLVTAVSVLVALAVSMAYWGLRQRASRTAVQLDQVSSELVNLQTNDPVTGMRTPRGFERDLDEACWRSDSSGQPACLLYLDIDYFRATNEAYGRTVGDLVLQEVAQRIQSTLLPGAAVARWVGNEFALVADVSLADAKALAMKLRAALAVPIARAGGEVRLTCSVGVAAYPHHGSRRNIVEKAALAMRTVKLQGGNGFAEYDQPAAQGRRDSARLLHDLRCAVERQQLELFYQPKVDARTLQITAVEALVRWHHPQLGMLSPDRFIGLAERYGVIQSLGRWVIEEACRQAQIWRGQGLRMRIAVNISAHQMRQDDFFQHLMDVLKRTQTPPSRFTCEITESIAMEDTVATMQVFDRLGKLGIHVSIDDFGTGHSSLASLKRLPASELKIDRAFITDLGVSEHAQFIAQTIVDMAHELKLKVVAEGVETRKQRDILVEMGCDELQGYLFAKPMRANELGLWAGRDPSDAEHLFRPSLFSETLINPLE